MVKDTKKLAGTSIPVAKPKPIQYDFKPILISPLRAVAKQENLEGELPKYIDMEWQKQPDKLEACLDKFGAQGFEPCFQFTFPGGNFTYLIFKREKV